jgi:hypothetical protein
VSTTPDASVSTGTLHLNQSRLAYAWASDTNEGRLKSGSILEDAASRNPFCRASLRPIAIACLRLCTLRPEPLLSVPRFLRCIADLTRLPTDFPYFAMASHARKARAHVRTLRDFKSVPERAFPF